MKTVHGALTHLLATQVWLCPQGAQVIMPPQPSPIVPHLAPAASQVCVLQPHRLGEPAPPQV
jgi:hypothetical protein